MERKNNMYFCIIGIIILIFSNCESTRKYEFICQNTMSVHILNNGYNYYFSIPIQYVGDYQIETFEFQNAYVLIGDYKILLEKENIKTTILLNKLSDEYGNTEGAFDTVYLEENGKIMISKMDEPIPKNNTMNLYNINIERILNNDEIKNIINEYKNLKSINYGWRAGNTNSKINIEYKLTIDNELSEYGMSDYFEFKINYD